MTKLCDCGRGRPVYAKSKCKGCYYSTPEQRAKSRARCAAPDKRIKARAESQKWRELNRERDRANAKSYRERHPEKARAAVKRWEQANPDRCANYRAKRRALLKNGSFTREEWRDLVALYAGTCPRCQKAVKRFSVDHITPISKGGSNYIWNVQPLCRSCNSRKRASTEGFYPPPCWLR